MNCAGCPVLDCTVMTDEGRVLYYRDRKAIGALFTWKDEVVDPHIRAIPAEYVPLTACNRKHDEILYEVRHTRELLEKHVINGNGSGGPKG